MLMCKLEVLTSCYIRRLDKSSESASRKHSVVVEFTLVRSHHQAPYCLPNMLKGGVDF